MSDLPLCNSCKDIGYCIDNEHHGVGCNAVDQRRRLAGGEEAEYQKYKEFRERFDREKPK